jgi:hypothetical protein
MVRSLAGLAGLILVLGAGVVLVRTSRKAPPAVLGTRQTQSPTPSDSSVPVPTPETSISPFSGTIPTPSQSASREPVTPAACHNSLDPACGPFSWTSQPGSNASMRITVSWDNGNPVAGQIVTFTVTLSDADAAPLAAYPKYGDGSGQTPPDCTQKRYGPWDPPSRAGGTSSFTFQHRYTKAGTYRAVFTGRTGSCGNPYGNQLASLPIKIVVSPADTSTPSPSPSPSESSFPI